jgi:dTDP-4-amino-4,6-dideoxygalactose transaminase
LLLVHLYGQVRGMDIWIAFCDRHRIPLVEDCVQAYLATWGVKVAGSFGVVGAYSYYPTKNLGDAGMLVTNDNEVSQYSERLRNYDQSVCYHHTETGMNSRLDEIHAAMFSER